jgi:hypothetical protein
MTPWLPHPAYLRRFGWTLLFTVLSAVLVLGGGRAEASAAADTALAPARPDSVFSWTLTLASQTDSRGELRPCT